MKKSKLIGWLLNFVKPLKGKMTCAILLGILSNLAVIAIPMIGALQVINILAGDFRQLSGALWLMVGCGIFRGFARYAEQYLNHDIAFQLLAIIRSQIFKVLRRLGASRLASKKSGSLVTAITADVEALEVFFAHTISPCFIALGTTLVTVALQLSFDIRLGLLLLLGQVLVGVVVPFISYHHYQKTGDDYQETFAALNQTVMENVESLGEIVQFQLGALRLKELRQKGQHLNQQTQRRMRQGTYIQIFSELILIATGVLTLLLGSAWQLPFPSVLLTTVLSLSSFGSVLALSGLGNALLATFDSGERLYQLAHETPSVTFKNQETQTVIGQELAAHEVCFHYPEQQENILKEVSCALKKGQTIGIGGASGSGKTSLLGLFLRNWDPKSGTLTLDDVPLTALTETQLRTMEGVMEQTTFLFETSIAENISLGNLKFSQAEIETAAKKAQIHDWILSLPEGYETKFEKNTRVVSDGERQRLGLARLFLYDAPIFLLDEPTSNLDYLNEQKILNLLKTECRDKASLIISHRETTLAIADKTYHLQHGQLIEK